MTTYWLGPGGSSKIRPRLTSFFSGNINEAIEPSPLKVPPLIDPTFLNEQPQARDLSTKKNYTERELQLMSQEEQLRLVLERSVAEAAE